MFHGFGQQVMRQIGDFEHHGFGGAGQSVRRKDVDGAHGHIAEHLDRMLETARNEKGVTGRNHPTAADGRDQHHAGKYAKKLRAAMAVRRHDIAVRDVRTAHDDVRVGEFQRGEIADVVVIERC